MLREIERRTGKPAAFIESDLVDPRYFSGANIKNRLESYSRPQVSWDRHSHNVGRRQRHLER